MIEIVGLREGKEFEAAVHLENKVLALWPDIAQSTGDHLKIFVGLKLYGYRVEDIDLIVICRLQAPRAFKTHPTETFESAYVKSFILVIEVKSHDASAIRFEDKIASVRYGHGDRVVWECVTEKNRQQMFEFKRYLSDHGAERLFLQNLIFFTGLRDKDLPARPHNCFGADASFETILTTLNQISQSARQRRGGTISFGSDDTFNKILSSSFPLLQQLQPTSLDRRKMDRIAKAAIPENWLEELGHKQIIIRGRGGVGKTVILLQMAYRAFDREHLRSLVLTYNKALVADMRRTMALLGVPRSIEDGGISIDTVHAFIGRMMHGLGIIRSDDHFLETYEERKQLLLQYVREGAVSNSDVQSLQDRNPNDFVWDLVFVDEGQDWPANEIEILRVLYPSRQVVVADGVDQLVRNYVADWSSGIPREQLRVRRLRRCLRMKANLALFVSEFAKALDLQEWDLEPNPDANGGRVFVVEGNLARDVAFYEQLCSEASGLGNYPVDLLACVPSSLVLRGNNPICSLPGSKLSEAGKKVWDASALDVRKHFPTERDSLRIVQYDSCRGLEGWTVINYAFDEFWDYKRRQWLTSARDRESLFETVEERAASFASRWAMIPLTRAMDTLVINVSARPSPIKKALAYIQERRADFMTWIRLA
jgi:hypothetical protein